MDWDTFTDTMATVGRGAMVLNPAGYLAYTVTDTAIDAGKAGATVAARKLTPSGAIDFVMGREGPTVGVEDDSLAAATDNDADKPELVGGDDDAGIGMVAKAAIGTGVAAVGAGALYAATRGGRKRGRKR